MGFLLEDVAVAVERRHYPGLPPPRRQPFCEVLSAALRLGLLAIAVNLLALPFYFWPAINLLVDYGFQRRSCRQGIFHPDCAPSAGLRDGECNVAAVPGAAGFGWRRDCLPALAAGRQSGGSGVGGGPDGSPVRGSILRCGGRRRIAVGIRANLAGRIMAIFSRNKKAGDDEENPTMERESELELPAKPASRPSAGGAVPSRAAAMPPMRPGENRPGDSRGAEARSAETRAMEGKPVAEMTRPSEMARRLVEAPPPARQEPEMRKSTVGREISLQGEITHCDHLVVEGSVTANLSGCHEVEIMESGVFKGSVEIDQIEVRGLFEGTLNVTGRVLIRSTGRVVGKVRYGQIEIEIGGQISGEVQAQSQSPAQAQPKVAAKPAVAAAAPAGIL